MANTLKFGNGEWAVKEGSALAYNDENGNFKPLPFDFSRNTTATYVAEDGLIKTAAIGEPRIDFLDDSEGALLLEPQRTNLYTYSEDLTQGAWTKLTNSTAVANVVISPDGTQNSSEVKAVATSTSILCVQDSFVVSSGVSYTVSFFAKKGVARYIQLFHGGSQVTGNARTNFDLEDGVVTVSDASHTSTIEDFGNGWFRCVVELNTLTTNLQTYFNAVKEPNAPRSATSSWSANDNFYFWGAQLESNSSYPTSYIPTQGSSVTRVYENSLQGGFQDKNIFGSTQGTVVLEFKWDVGAYVFDLSDASGIRLRIFDGGSDWKIRDYTGASWVNTGFAKSNNVKTKIAFKWNGTELTTFQDGVKSSSTDSFASSMSIESITTNKLNNTSNMQFYNTALTDQELINLTTL